jgi:hypothetical protein
VPFHRDVWWLFGSVAAAIAAAPLIVRGDAQTTARRTAAAQKIEQLSPAEREELDKNFTRFNKLPPADQAKYREMHAKLQQNPAVTEALDTFSHWWGNVSAREQGEVSRQPDVKQRIAAVSQIQEEIDNKRGGRMFFGRSYGGDGFRWGPPLPKEAFYEIMQTLEALASESYVVQKELPEIQKLDVKNPLRYQKLLIALHDHKQKWSTLVPDPNAENRIVESISDEKTKEMVRSRMGDRGPGSKNGYLRGQLAVSLGKELMFEGLKQKFGEEELQKRLASLSEDEKSELYSLPGDDGRWVLKMRMMREAWQDSQAVQEFYELGGFGRGGFGPGTGSRGDGRDGRGDGQPGRGDGQPGRGDGPGRPEPPPRRMD